MLYCGDCGTEIASGEACNKCGTARIDSSVSPQPSFGSKQPSISAEAALPVPAELVVKSKPFLNQFQKNVLFIAVTVFILVGASIWVNSTIQARARHLEEQKVEWRKANIKILKDLSGIGALSTEEQTRVDNAGDDLDRLQQVLLDIHQERINYWTNQLEDVEERKHKVQTLSTLIETVSDQSEYSEAVQTVSKQEEKAEENLGGYESSKAKIRQWKPVSFEDFRAGKLIDPGSTEPPKAGEQ
jgi:hypothetical protein